MRATIMGIISFPYLHNPLQGSGRVILRATIIP